MTTTADLDVELPRTPTAPAAARIALRSIGEGRLQTDVLADAAVLVTELVTNAYRHGEGAIRLRLSLNPGRLRVEVFDDGQGFEPVRCSEDLGPGGHGLILVGSIATRWGVREGRSHVWCELATPAASPITSRRVADACRAQAV